MHNTKYVLAVDDEEITLDLIGRYLKLLGVPYLLVSSGRIALQVLREQAEQIGLVLLDIALPEMNGYEISRAIRTDLLLTDLPIVALTAMVEIELPLRAAEAGMNGVITKPFRRAELEAVLHQYGLVNGS